MHSKREKRFILFMVKELYRKPLPRDEFDKFDWKTVPSQLERPGYKNKLSV